MAEADEVVAVGAEGGGATMAVAAVVGMVVGEGDTEEGATGGELRRSISVIRLILHSRPRFGSVF